MTIFETKMCRISGVRSVMRVYFLARPMNLSTSLAACCKFCICFSNSGSLASNTLKIENLQNVQNPEGHPQKENRQRIVISSACCSLYFWNRNWIVWSRFQWFYLATVLIPVSARTLPSSAAMQIEIRLWTLVAHAGRNFYIRFFNLFEQSLLLFCESGSELCFKPHNGYKRSAFVCAFLLYSALFFQRMSALMQS